MSGKVTGGVAAPPATDPPSVPELRVAHLTGQYQGREVHDICLQVAGGQCLAILGSPGAGKTALLALLAGLPSAHGQGEIRFNGERIDQMPASLRRVAFVPADYGLWPQRSVADQLRFVNANVASWQPWVTRLGLEPLLPRTPPQLTPAERLRVAWARAVLAAPRVILLDDVLWPWRDDAPTSWWAMMDELRQWRQAAAPIPVILSTSRWLEAARLGDEILLLNGGQSWQCGSAQQLCQEPQCVGAARASSPWPINVLPAILETPAAKQPSAQDNPMPASQSAPDGDRPTAAHLTEDGWSLPLVAAAQKAIADWWQASGQKQRAVLVGLRPEQIHLRARGASTGAPDAERLTWCCWSAQVVAAENWGWASWVGVRPQPQSRPDSDSTPAAVAAAAASGRNSPWLWVLEPASLASRLWSVGDSCEVCLPTETGQRPLLFDPVTEQRLALPS